MDYLYFDVRLASIERLFSDLFMMVLVSARSYADQSAHRQHTLLYVN